LATAATLLGGTAQNRATCPGCNAIAVCFGTGRVFTILTHLQRGILRVMALEQVLLALAARGGGTSGSPSLAFGPAQYLVSDCTVKFVQKVLGCA
jgi:hypothetical protein